MESARIGEMGTQSSQDTEISARTAKVATSVLLGKVVVFLLTGVSFIVVARLLGPSTYGIYTLAIAVIGIFGSVGDLGIGVSFNKFIPEYMERRERTKIKGLLVNGYALLALFGGALTLITFLLAGTFSVYIFHNASYSGLVELASFLIMLSILYGDSYSALIGFRSGRKIALTAGVEAAFQSSVSIALAVLGFGAAAPILGLISGYAAGIAVALILIRRFVSGVPGSRMSGPAARDLLRFSLPIGVSNILGAVVSNISLVVLALFATSVVIGNFGVASRVGSLIDLITGSISVSLITMFSAALSLKKSKSEISRMYNYSLYLAFVLVAPLLFFIGVLAKPFSYTAFSGLYTLAPLYMAIMAFGILLGLVGTYAYNLFVSANKVRSILKYSIVATAVQFALLPVLIPLFKGIGLVVLLFIIAPMVADILYMNGLRRTLGISINAGKISRVIAANIISFAFVFAADIVMKNLFMPLLVVSAALVLIVYPAMLSILGGLRERDAEIIKDATAEIPVIGIVVGYLLRYAGMFMQKSAGQG